MELQVLILMCGHHVLASVHVQSVSVRWGCRIGMTESIYLPEHKNVQMPGLIASLRGRDVENARNLIETGQ